ncbi:MAG: transporter [Desulfobacteraceae bacterium]|nr:MAG: transporter [Desulfobacteraceae bacterium]
MFHGDSFFWTPLIATAAFIATNIDDLFILMLFFSQTNHSFTQQDIVAGQYLGFSTLVILSLAGFFGSYIVPQNWIGLLGLAPIAIGVYRFMKRGQNQDPEINLNAKPNFLTNRFLNPKIYGVALVTIANGADNIGIYTPLFAESSLARLLVILCVFMLLVGVWCFIGHWLTHRQTIARLLSRYGDFIVPLVLIAFGIYILIKNDTLGLIGLFRI